jgi:hypothetical protein
MRRSYNHPFGPCSIVSTQCMPGTTRVVPWQRPALSALPIACSQRERGRSNGRALRTCLQGMARGIGLGGTPLTGWCDVALEQMEVTSLYRLGWCQEVPRRALPGRGMTWLSLEAGVVRKTAAGRRPQARKTARKWRRMCPQCVPGGFLGCWCRRQTLCIWPTQRDPSSACEWLCRPVLPGEDTRFRSEEADELGGKLAEMHGSRTHPGPCSDPTLVLKTRRLTGTDAPPRGIMAFMGGPSQRPIEVSDPPGSRSLCQAIHGGIGQARSDSEDPQ